MALLLQMGMSPTGTKLEHLFDVLIGTIKVQQGIAQVKEYGFY